MYYIGLLWAEPDGGFSVAIPDFPGCYGTGETLDSAAADAAMSLRMHVYGVLDDGDPLPAPSGPDSIGAAPDGAVAILVPAPPVGMAQAGVTMTEALLAEVDAAAKRAGVSRSAFLADAAARHLSPGESDTS